MGMENMGTLQQLRSLFVPQIPPALEHGRVQLLRGDTISAAHSSDEAEIRTSFNFTYDHPLVEFVSQNLVNGEIEGNICRAVTRVGVVFGMEAESPGAHNVIAGIFDALKAHNNNSILFGFVGGIDGLCSQNKLVVTDDLLKGYRNQGGCDLLGQSSKKIHEFQQMEDARSSCITLKLDGLVFVGGCSANTDAARLAEYFKSTKCQTTVVGVPVTLEGDLKNEFVETDVGYDTVCKVSSQLIGNICLDALSAGKYYFFVRLAGKGASHVALECSLQSNPNLVILGEEVATSNMTLSQVTNCICDAIQARAEKGKYHGVIILSEGLIENIVDIRLLIQEIKGLLKEGISTKKCPSLLSPSSAALLKSLPLFIQKQLLEEMETEGLNYLSNIETEKLLAKLAEDELAKRKKAGTYTAKKLDSVCHFLCYQSRGSLPSNFDCNYAFTLGQLAFYLVINSLNGYMATVTNLIQPVSKWRCGAVPFTAMMTLDTQPKDCNAVKFGELAIHSEKVNLKGKPIRLLLQNAQKWLMDDLYVSSGPIQYQGPGSDSRLITVSSKAED